jgi:hypothetical protein
MPEAEVDLPIERVRAHLGPGPIVLVTSMTDGEHKVITLG